MKTQTYGYVRISTKEQNEARQLAALAEYEIPQRNLFIDRPSGKDFDRPAYKRLMKRLHPGDLLIVQSIDRLGRNYGEILEQWRVITKEKQAEGIAAARARAVKFGAPKKPLPEDFTAAHEAWQTGKLSIREAAKAAGMPHMTFYRRCKEQEAQRQADSS